MRLRPLYVGLLSILGLALLFLALDEFNTYLARLSEPARPTVRTAPRRRPTATPVPTPTPAPPPSAEELERIETSDPIQQAQALRVLGDRAVTSETLRVVRRIRPLTFSARESIACVEYRAPEPEALDRALSWLAEEDTVWPQRMELTLCALGAVAAWGDREPARVMAGLLPYAFSYPGRPREVVLAGLRRIKVNEIPPTLRAHLFDGISPPMGVKAALALGAERHSTEEVVEWLFNENRGIRQTVAAHLRRSDAAQAPQIIARALAAAPSRADLIELARKRQAARHDVNNALADLAADSERPPGERQAALEWLGLRADVDLIPAIAALSDAGDESVRSYAVAAVAEIRRRHRRQP